MPRNDKKNVNTASSKTKLLGASAITKLIVTTVAAVKASLDELHNCRVQCLLHAEKHGDHTLLEKLTQEVMVHCPMVDMNAWKMWIHDHSPVRIGLKLGEDGKVVKDPETGRAIVTAETLASDAPGFVPFQTETAETKTLESDVRAISRQQRDLEPINIAWVKGQVARIKKQIENAKSEGNRPFGTKDESGKIVPMTEYQMRQLDSYLNSLVGTPVPDLSASEPVASSDSKGQSRGAVIAAKAATRETENGEAPEGKLVAA